MPRIEINKIGDQLSGIGIKAGDTIFLSADLMRVGYFEKNRERTYRNWVNLFLELIGNDGTLVIPAYTPAVMFYRSAQSVVFQASSQTTSGALSEAISAHPLVQRSTHPIMSCYAIGKNARDLCINHTENSLGYDIYSDVRDLNGKNLMLGTVHTDNGPMSYHLAQQELGITKRHPLSMLTKCTYKNPSNELETFYRKDFGGCTAGSHVAYGELLKSKSMLIEKVGKSYSACIDIRSSTIIYKKLLAEHPSVFKCQNEDCVSCYGRFKYNGVKSTLYYPRQISKRIKSHMKSQS